MFRKPMLAKPKELPGLPSPEDGWVAEPKLDGQRAQVHVAGGRTVAAYSRPGRELLARHRGLRWLRDVRWPVEGAVIDGELYSGDGMDGIDGILTARQQAGSPVTFAAFDVLEVAGHEVMAEPWADRRKRLEDLPRRRDRRPRAVGSHVRGCPAALGQVGGRVGRRRHRAEGSPVDLPARHAVAVLVEGEEQDHNAARGAPVRA